MSPRTDLMRTLRPWLAALWLGHAGLSVAATPCAAFGLAAGTMQQDFLAGRPFEAAVADGARLVGGTPARNALIVRDLGRRIYTDPASRARSAAEVERQITAQCRAQNGPATAVR